MSALSTYSFEAHLRTELWTSFASLLRSYCAAHGLNSTHQAVVEVSADTITIRVADRWLMLVEHLGNVIVTRGDGLVRAFRLEEDGTMTGDGFVEDMDTVAERLAREMFTA